MKPRISIIGGGVVGLTCADVLARDFDVTLVADLFAAQSASIVATAIWHVYLVDKDDVATLQWARETLEQLMSIERAYPEAGVSLVRGVEVFRKSEPHIPSWANIPSYFKLLSPEEVARFAAMDASAHAERLPIRWGYRIEAPAATMDRYLPWLFDRVRAKGVRHVERRLETIDQAADYGDLVVNCSGYGARKLAPHAGISPVKGQYLIYSAGTDGPREYFGDDDHPIETCYLIPRAGEVIIGGTEEYGEEDETFTRRVDELIERIEPFEPWVKSLYGREPLRSRVGLRPYRAKGVLLELAETPAHVPVIHNIGHGGSGFSLSWGCANAVHALAAAHFSASFGRIER